MVRLNQTWRALLLALLLSTVTLAAFWPVIHNDFVGYDDDEYLTNNPHVLSGLRWQNFKWAFQAGYSSNWHPLTWFSHMLDVQLFGPQPRWHHLISLLLHTVNALLLFGLLRWLTGTQWRSLLVAALFALHPLHVESVAWASERKDVLSTFFFLLNLWAYSAYVRKSEGKTPKVDAQHSESKVAASPTTQAASHLEPHPSFFYALSLLLFALGLMSKPMLVTLPFVLLLLDYWPLDRFSITNQTSNFKHLFLLLREKIPFLGLALAASGLTLLAQTKGFAMHLHLPLASRLANAVASCVKYLAMTLRPAGLTVFYPHPDTRYPVSGQWRWWQLAAAAFLLAAISLWALLKRNRAPWFAMGWFWYLVTLLPVIGIIQVGGQAMADRYTYIPLIGIFICVAWGAAGLANRGRVWQAAITGAGLLSVGACAALTHHQVQYWRNSTLLFDHALKVTTHNALAHYFVGTALLRQGQTQLAMEHFQAAVDANPEYVYGYLGMGAVLVSLGKTEQALETYRAGTRVTHSAPLLYNHIATLLWSLGRKDEALAQYAEALRFNPDFSDAHYNLGVALSDRGDYTSAAQHFAAVLRIRPLDREALAHLAEALVRLGRLPEAEGMLVQAVRRRPSDLEALTRLGQVLVEEGKMSAAQGEFRQAVRLFPTNAALQISLGSVLLQSGDTNEATTWFASAAALDPGLAEKLVQAGKTLASQGQLQAALARFSTALRLKPDWGPALAEMAWLLATANQNDLRNGSEALRLAQQLCATSMEPRCWDILGAAYAEVGRFPDARRAAEKARDLALT
ncbi:MAG TPA: tetratricopeptide repeat protein [Candidatus Binatia bacterium]|jgi:tetratricopeptide (TPR) repeat protein|nr:tetratricopeptide repeat protein [Candidatus Binatia bacterium]